MAYIHVYDGTFVVLYPTVKAVVRELQRMYRANAHHCARAERAEKKLKELRKKARTRRIR